VARARRLPARRNAARARSPVHPRREAEFVRPWREDTDPELLGERKEAAGEAFHRDVARFLQPEQLTTFLQKFAPERVEK